MTRVAITQSYRHGCEECAEHLIRLARWAANDGQVTSLTFQAAAKCDHVKPEPPKPLPSRPNLFAMAAKPDPPPPPTTPVTSQAPPENIGDRLRGTGYDEPMS